jgi:glucuronokinase
MHADDSSSSSPAAPPGSTYGRAFARVGLLGNPSDGYGGKTTATTISNFLAEAWVTPTPDGRVELVPHALFDPLRYANVAQLATVATREGYSGGVRLMAATLNRLHQHMAARGVRLPAERGFSLRYHTTVPRQVGLAGSSALVTAMLRALLAFYGYASEDARGSVGLPCDRLASFVLQIEAEELGITAGLQDRVVQAYEGLVHMDFRVDTLRANDGMGVYTQLPVAALPPLFLAYAADPSDSGRIHAPVKQRWLAGDAEVVAGMNRIAALADEALALCTSEWVVVPRAGCSRSRASS